MKVNRTTLKGFFKRGKYPTESHFAAIFDSFVHQDDSIQTSQVEGLDDALAAKFDTASAETIVQACTTAVQRLDQFSTLIANLQTLVENSDAMSVAEQAQQAASTANATNNRMDHIQQNIATMLSQLQTTLSAFDDRITALENANASQEGESNSNSQEEYSSPLSDGQ